MKYPLSIAQYFKNAAAAAQSNRPRPQAPFVTIAREAGAGGHALADALVARISKEKAPLFSGWQIFDKNLCERVANDPGLHVSLKSLLEEEYHTGVDEFLRSVLADVSPQITINHHMFRTVRSVCVLGKAIVIGRAAALITRDLPLGVHVRLVSARRARVERIRRKTGLGAAAVGKMLDQKDARRALMVDKHFNKDIASPLLYDCVWNADTVSYEAMAESLVSLILQRVSRGLRAKAASPMFASSGRATS
jgi:cytidylate kinase